jgi:predicted metal-dependent phosphoesterase TrpH
VRVDLQSHSLYSDGELAPATVVELAAQAGVELLALTDHDTVAGIEEALRAARERSIGLIAATEISAVDADYEDLHVLGYAIDHRDPLLARRLADARADRDRRAERMTSLLRELGFAVDEAVLETRRKADKPVGRPHLAAAVLAHPDNAERLRREGHDDISSFIPAYLIPGTAAYAGRTSPTIPEAIGWIHEAGGVAVWAHPFWDVDQDAAVLAAIDRYRAAGLDGVECFYITHNEHQTRLLSERCHELGLITTASSDFHGPRHRLFSRFLAYAQYDLEPSLGTLAPGNS